MLFAMLAGALGWSGWLALNEPAEDAAQVELAEPRAAAPTRIAPPPVPSAVGMTAAPRVRLAAARTNLFPEQTWFVPPPPPPPPPYVPPPPPQAPALPYTYVGRWIEGNETTWYLNRGGTPLAVRTGQVLDSVWRLEAAHGGILNFTYLPLNQTRSLRTGD